MRIMFVGDSLTGGQLATVDDLGFPRLIRTHLRESREVESFVVSSPGGTVAAIRVSDVESNVDLALVELGTNDSLHTLPWVFVRKYDALLGQIRATSPDAGLICVGLWRRAWRAGVYDRIIRRLAAKHGAAFVPLSDMYPVKALRLPAGVQVQQGITDGFHPNDHGHAAIAERLLPVVLDRLGEPLNLGSQ